ncbi:MAG TPA: nucleoside triphosphate pyrophosphatase [Dokdonella sp.]|uniref:Maf family protein n=1 Tax=Dokdonella sp. TaxID=2291710 RepID=UPI002D7EDA5A|nr:nucleoside triphosphate pyrophosphatase [Dokdonella sp.]HET9031296.1 nucleoside triphosphate pyrophosphatase [Dokdonella sp.]
MTPPRPIVLASSSPYRAELLKRVVAEFETCAAQVDETAVEDEMPAATAIRLARNKASAVASRYPDCIVIGSDQVAELDGEAIGKPHDFDRARAQLLACSARIVDFHTAVCLIDPDSGSDRQIETLDTTRVVFRELGEAEISRYLAIDKPFDCAGSFKIENAGVALFERVESSDPAALVGLPLIALCRLLRQAGVQLP